MACVSLSYATVRGLVAGSLQRNVTGITTISYSGTVAGAIEGALLSIPSIAMSLVIGSTEIDQGGGKPKWETPSF